MPILGVVVLGLGASFVGRAAEIADLCGLLDQRHLVTLVGEGGVGKTRLAREVTDAADATWQVFWVDLGSAVGADGVHASFEDALRPTSRSASFEDLIADRLPAGPCLVAIDNCEHVLDDVAERIGVIGGLRADARVLATSRTRLGVTGEVAYRLAPLPVPSPDDAAVTRAGQIESVALLVDRLRDVITDFELTLRGKLPTS